MLALVPSTDTDTFVTLAEVAAPVPAPGEILIDVEVFSLNRPDFLYLSMLGFNWRVGIDYVGTVAVASNDGIGPALGDRVLVHSPGGGGGAQKVVAPAASAMLIPSEVDSVTAAALPLAGLVAWRMIKQAKVGKGTRVLVTGATGGVGHFAVEMAHAAGANVVALARPQDDYTGLERFGARVVHDLASVERSFDVILESIGGEILTEALLKIKKNGLILWFGAASGQPATIDFFSQFPDHSSFTLRHFVYGEVEGADDGQDIARLFDLVRAGKLHPAVTTVQDWRNTDAVLSLIRDGRLTGKAVMTVSAGG